MSPVTRWRSGQRLALLSGCLAVGACADEQATTEPPLVALPGPVLTISDGANGGNPHFFFVQPRLGHRSSTGAFDPTRLPEVRICLLSGTACAQTIATFRTGGAGPEAIQVDTEGETYGMVWQTRNYALTDWPDAMYRATVYTGEVMLGFFDFWVRHTQNFACWGTEPGSCPPFDAADVVAGRPFPIRFRIEEGWLTQTIAFNTDRDGSLQVFVMNDDGSGQVQLTRGGVSNGEPEWSPDGRRLAFYSWRDATFPDNWTSEIYTMDPDGTRQARLTHDELVQAEPAWSPDGRTIVVHGYTGGIGVPRGDSDLYAVDAVTGEMDNLTNYPDADDFGPAYGPPGRGIVFTSLRDGFFELHRMYSGGGGVEKLQSPAPLYDVQPKVSPDGSRIVFVSFRDGNTEIYVADSGGRYQQRLTAALGEDVDPAWSPDGSKIVFSSNRDGDFDIYMMNADGTNLRQLTNAPGADRMPEWRR